MCLIIQVSAEDGGSASVWSPYVSPLNSQDEMSRLAQSEFGQDDIYVSRLMETGTSKPSSNGLPPETPKGLIQQVTFGGSWTPAIGHNGMALTDFNAAVTLGLPGPKCGRTKTPSFFLLTPSFTYTNLDWKGPGKIPESLYNAGLSVGWMKPVNKYWTFMTYASPSYASDGHTSQETMQCGIMAGMNWTPNPHWKIVFGAVYLDRGDIPVIPYGGLVYSPGQDWRFELTVPQAKIARRLTFVSGSRFDHWVYLGGGFNGGSWAIESVFGRPDIAMSREYTVCLGYESTQNSYKFNAEIGYLFGRKMKFEHDTQPSFSPGDSLALRLKFTF
jgi:hypothetical protein